MAEYTEAYFNAHQHPQPCFLWACTPTASWYTSVLQDQPLSFSQRQHSVLQKGRNFITSTLQPLLPTLTYSWNFSIHVCWLGMTRFDSVGQPSAAGICIYVATWLPSWRCVFNWWRTCLKSMMFKSSWLIYAMLDTGELNFKPEFQLEATKVRRAEQREAFKNIFSV